MLPGSTAERAMIEAVFVLIAGELADFTERGVVEVVAVAVEAIFGKVLIVFDVVFGAEFFGFGPGFCFDFDKFDV